MKALLLSPSRANINPQMLTGLRQRIGTCESLVLTAEQFQNLERFFDSFVRLSQFDRIVLAFSQQEIHQQSLFIRQLPHLTVLNLGQSYDAQEKRLLRRNLHVMPWMRFISHDYQLVQFLISDGFDAFWIPPICDPAYYHLKRRLELPHRIYALDPSGEIQRYYRKHEVGIEVNFLSPDTVLNTILHPQDVFIYWPENIHQQPNLMISAMAMGAVVVAKYVSEDIAQAYGWKDGKNCLLSTEPMAALENAQILAANPDMLRKYAINSVEAAEYFSPQSVGELLGVALEPHVRRAMDYPKKIRIFGFEI